MNAWYDFSQEDLPPFYQEVIPPAVQDFRLMQIRFY